ncbi:MAG: hypothetical protein LHV69_00690 [Elusimicrobia bacterium]|nr:hypothetical protein [Candidatus Obscuribacterium magneticum]
MKNNKKLGIAITLYDKFDDLAILHDIFRYNFKNRYFLYVCSNYDDATKEMTKRRLEFAGFVQGENIEYDPSKTQRFQDRRFLITARSTTSLQRSCQLAMRDGCDYVMHIHCDAWPLSEQKLLDLFDILDEEQYWLAMRSNMGYFMPDNPVGTLDDHFFFFNAKKMSEYKVFDFDVMDQLPHLLTIHGILALQFMAKLPRARILEYSDWTDTLRWPGGDPVAFPIRPVRPASLDPARKFIHIHTADFPGNMGHRLQSFYLTENNLMRGPAIEYHLQKHSGDKRILADLKNWWMKNNKSFIDRILGPILTNSQKKKVLKKIQSHFGQAYPLKIDDFYRSFLDYSKFKDRNSFWFSK